MVVATGFFDGVHLGHRFIIDLLVSQARRRGEKSTVVTFWPHPRVVLQNGARTLRLLSTVEEKKEILSSLGVDNIEVIPFTKEFASLTAEEYLKKYVIELFGGSAIVLGYDNRMGSDSCTPDEMSAIAKSVGLDVFRAESVVADSGVVISSTKIRNLLAVGNVKEASEMLGYNYGLYGVVVSGNRIGRTLGFPTANMELYEPLKLVPGNGVYLVEVKVQNVKYFGMCNIGVRPTIGKSNAMTIETHIFDFNQDIYGMDISLRFLSMIRAEKCFPNLFALKQQLNADMQECKELLTSYSSSL